MSFYIGTYLSLFVGLTLIVTAKSAIHEIEAFILFAISAILFSTIHIIKSINNLDSVLKK